jgi:23S rRNA (uracil1939-C5)-methyltransferase
MEEIKVPTYFVEAIDLTHDAFGVCKLEDGYTVFVDDMLKGEKAEIIITDRKKSYGFGRVVTMLEKSPYRVNPRCAHYYECGGCNLMHMEYDLQLAFKKYRIETTLKRQGLGTVVVNDMVGMASPYYYRNKVEIKFQQGEKGIEAGFYQTKSHQLVNLQECHIMPKRAMDLIILLKNVCNELGIVAFQEKLNTGFLKSAVIREASKTKQLSLLLQAVSTEHPSLEQLVKKLVSKMPELVNIAVSESKDPSTLSTDKMELLHGAAVLKDTIGNLTFEIGYRSFFQTNAVQTEKLYNKALEYAALTGKERVIDAYCGIGTISLYVAPYAFKVFGIEVVKSAIMDARRNAELNGVKNVFFEVGESESVIKKWLKYKFDVIFVDPPRKGCNPSLLESIIQMKITKVIYISCDQATLARDVKVLVDGGYTLKEITPFDMFPQTVNVESVAFLTLNNKPFGKL